MRRRLLALTSGALLTVSACGTAAGDTEPGAVVCPEPVRPVAGAGAYLGVNLDWGSQTLAEYGAALGTRPAVAVSFTGFPFSPADEPNLDAAVEQVRADGGLLLLTLEPHDGLAAVTDAAAAGLAERVAGAVHTGAPGSAVMWAPNYGGGYPFTGGAFAASPADVALLDTDGHGALSAADDPYAPYWPGGDAVDWVGMSLYHWGDAYPWGENEVPEPGKFVAQLTGTYAGRGGDDRGLLPDFHAAYGERYGKPVAVPETAAFFAPGAGGSDELAFKQAWWQQLFDPQLTEQLPRLAMVNWFEWANDEPEVGGLVDWRAAGSPGVRDAFRADLPEWALDAGDVPRCGT